MYVCVHKQITHDSTSKKFLTSKVHTFNNINVRVNYKIEKHTFFLKCYIVNLVIIIKIYESI